MKNGRKKAKKEDKEADHGDESKEAREEVEGKKNTLETRIKIETFQRKYKS